MGLINQIKTIKSKDPAIKSVFEVLLYPSIWAIAGHKISHPLYRLRLRFLARLVSQAALFFTGIEIHPGAKIGKGLFIDHGNGVVIGETAEIGDNVLIYQGVTLGGTGKDTGKRHPTIENGVMIGAGAKILGPFTVGENSRIGANSVVLREVPKGCTVVGVPARVVKRADSEKTVMELDQTRLPDPVEMDICALRVRIEALEKLLKEKNEGKNETL